MLPKKKVLISGGLSAGGPQTHIKFLSKLLIDKNAEVTVVASASNWPRHELNELVASGVRVIVSPFGFGRWAFLAKVYTVVCSTALLRDDFDLVYCIGDGRMHGFCKRFAKMSGKTIYHEINDWPANADIVADMNLLIGNSRNVSEKLREMFPEKQVVTIPFMTTGAPFPAEEVSYRESRKLSGELNVAFMGRLVDHKRPRELIANWKRVVELARPRIAKLHFFGSDCGSGLAQVLKSIADEHGITDAVSFHGEYCNSMLTDIFKRIDVVVLPSMIEGLPLVLVEAMQRGIPVVATPAGGTGEFSDQNPDVEIAEDLEFESFLQSLNNFFGKLNEGLIDPLRLHKWTESRYGYSRVSQLWSENLL